MDHPRLIMAWVPYREHDEWERRCIARAEELFDIRWLTPHDYDIPAKQFSMPHGPSEWMRWTELQTPYTLWADCDVYWHDVPVLGDTFRCDKMRGGYRPNDAVVWSGGNTGIPVRLLDGLRTNGKFIFAHKILSSLLREPGETWEYMDKKYYQHKPGRFEP